MQYAAKCIGVHSKAMFTKLLIMSTADMMRSDAQIEVSEADSA